MYRRIRGIYSFDYMGHKKWWFLLSGIIIGAGIVSLLVRGGGNPINGLRYGLEFKSGTRITVEFATRPSVADVRGVMEQQGIGNAVIQSTGAKEGQSAFQIQTPTLTPQKEQAVKQALDKAFTIAAGGKSYASESVGATFGKGVITASYKAVLLALLLILIYITFRFEWKFAVGAIAAELHDLLVVIGVYSLVGREVTTASVAAVLTILGYSLYDTVIVFDRIRENAPRMRGMRYGDMVNRSIWETLTRSINTTLTVLLPVICLLAFGGATLKDFAFALLVGIVSGAYSSIFVASPIATILKEREPQYRKIIDRAARAQESH
jgi:SecD/SecF fusion protein